MKNLTLKSTDKYLLTSSSEDGYVLLHEGFANLDDARRTMMSEWFNACRPGVLSDLCESLPDLAKHLEDCNFDPIYAELSKLDSWENTDSEATFCSDSASLNYDSAWSGTCNWTITSLTMAPVD